jgi:hypothetical protein
MMPVRRILASLLLLALGLVSRPAFAQVDLTGEWGQKISEDEPERGPGPEIGDYTGIPVTDPARVRADAWDAQRWEMLEHECEPHPADYAPRGPAALRMWSEVDPFTQEVVAWHMLWRYKLSTRTIYMDGRPHPSKYAAPTWQGFSTGEWEGDILKVTTDHLKEGWLRRNGLPRSEQATLIEYFIRHGEFFTQVTDVEDPLYLTEPFIRTSNWIVDLGHRFPAQAVACIPSVEIAHPKEYVAYHLPGKNLWLTEFASRYNIPVEASRGGAETMYPEYQDKLAKLPAPPPLRGAK